MKLKFREVDLKKRVQDMIYPEPVCWKFSLKMRVDGYILIKRIARVSSPNEILQNKFRKEIIQVECTDIMNFDILLWSEERFTIHVNDTYFNWTWNFVVEIDIYHTGAWFG